MKKGAFLLSLLAAAALLLFLRQENGAEHRAHAAFPAGPAEFARAPATAGPAVSSVDNHGGHAAGNSAPSAIVQPKPPAPVSSVAQAAGQAIAGAPALADARFAGLFRRLQLEPEKREQLKLLLREKQWGAADISEVSSQQRVDAAPADQMSRRNAAEIDEHIRVLLGGEGFAVYQDFNRNVGSHMLLDQLARRLEREGVPLAPAQMGLLVRTLIDTAAPPPVLGGSDAVAGPVVRAGVDAASGAPLPLPRITDDTLVKARDQLSPAQLEALRTVQIEQQRTGITYSTAGNAPPAPASVSAARPPRT